MITARDYYQQWLEEEEMLRHMGGGPTGSDWLPLLFLVGGTALSWFIYRRVTGDIPSPGWTNVFFFGSMIVLWVLTLAGFVGR